jgi:cysteinyl-tRNA synthetase
MLKLYNTLTKIIEEVPKKDHLNLYTCGPTVYNYAHIGNLRSYIMADLLYRTLKFDGYKPKWVMNITDIDDKTIKGAIAKFGKDATVENLREYTKFYLDEFLKDLGEVNVLKDEITFIRVTDVIPQIQQFIVDLISKGYAYKADDGSTYFSIEKYQNDPKLADYGQLVGDKFLEGKKVGARVAVDEYEKENLSDFALWKAWDASTDGNIFWDHPQLGKGRPGWHIECSVINQIGFNGEPTDIHTGGVDLIFPHHTNEIAQSQALVGKGNFVHHWFHSEHLLVDGKKMSKSAGNFYTLKDLKKKGFEGLDLRSVFFDTSYNSQQNFTIFSLESAKTGRERLSEKAKSLGEPDEKLSIGLLENFEGKINQDLNISAIPPLLRGAIETSDKKLLDKIELVSALNLKEEKINIIPNEIIKLLDQRSEAKQRKDFMESDKIRKQIEALGYEVMDTPEGQKVKKKLNI